MSVRRDRSTDLAPGMDDGNSAQIPPGSAAGPASGLLLADDLLVVFGWMPEPPPAEAAAWSGVEAAADMPAGIAWCLCRRILSDDLERCAFVAVVRMPNASRALLDGIWLRPDDQEQATPLWLPPLLRLGLHPAPLAAHMVEAGLAAGAVTGFLAAVLLQSEGMGALPAHRAQEFLRDLLLAAGRAQGFVEILASPECGGLMLQGWCAQAPLATRPDCPGEIDAVVEYDDGSLEIVRLHIAGFHRDDVLAPAQGLLGFARVPTSPDPAQVRYVHLAEGSQPLRLEVTAAHRVVLGPTEATAHLRRMLPRLRGGAPALRALRRTCRPRFAGIDTLHSAELPIRAGKDLLLPVADVGLLFTGWLLDPEAHADRVLLKSDKGYYARLDQRWVRRSRPDVSEGFARSPLFAGRIKTSDHMHGFIVLAPREAASPSGERFYLEVVLADGNCLFMPLGVDEDREPVQCFRDLLTQLTTDDPALDRLADEHLAPAAGAILQGRALAAVLAEVGLGTRPRIAPQISVIVPIGAGAEEVPALLALLAEDPMMTDGRAELLLVAAEPEARLLAGRWRPLAAFHGLNVRLVGLAAASVGACDAMTVGAERAKSEQLLFLAPGALPDWPGWLERLCAAHAALPAPGALSPTVLYEDGTPRYAGGTLAELAGRPRGHLPTGPRPAQSLAGECMLIDRRSLAAAGGMPRDLSDKSLVPLALAGQLAAAGIGRHWLPEVRLMVADPAPTPAGEREPWRGIAEYLDRRVLARRHPDLALGPLRAGPTVIDALACGT